MRLIFLDLNLQGLCKVFLALSITDKFPNGLQPTQGSLQEFRLLQEVLLPEGAGVH